MVAEYEVGPGFGETLIWIRLTSKSVSVRWLSSRYFAALRGLRDRHRERSWCAVFFFARVSLHRAAERSPLSPSVDVGGSLLRGSRRYNCGCCA